MPRPFKPGEQVRSVDLLPRPGYNTPGEDGQPIWVEPSVAITSRITTVSADGKSIPEINGNGTIPIDEKMVFHMDEEDKAFDAMRVLAQELKRQ